MKPVAIGITPGTLTAAILGAVGAAPLPARQILGALKPKGFNGHSIRTTLTTLTNSGALHCDRTQVPARYSLPADQAPASIAQRVLQALRTHGPQLSRELIARFNDLPAFSIRNALMSLQEDGRVDRVGTRHQYRYFATEHTPQSALTLASVTGELLRDSVPARTTIAQAPQWPATAARLGPPMIGLRVGAALEAAA